MHLYYSHIDLYYMHMHYVYTCICNRHVTHLQVLRKVWIGDCPSWQIFFSHHLRNCIMHKRCAKPKMAVSITHHEWESENVMNKYYWKLLKTSGKYCIFIQRLFRAITQTLRNGYCSCIITYRLKYNSKWNNNYYNNNPGVHIISHTLQINRALHSHIKQIER